MVWILINKYGQMVSLIPILGRWLFEPRNSSAMGEFPPFTCWLWEVGDRVPAFPTPKAVNAFHCLFRRNEWIQPMVSLLFSMAFKHCHIFKRTMCPVAWACAQWTIRAKRQVLKKANHIANVCICRKHAPLRIDPPWNNRYMYGYAYYIIYVYIHLFYHVYIYIYM